MIVNDQHRMLNSILERPRRGCMIDRVLIESRKRSDNPTLVTNLEEVKTETRNHFIKQFRKRLHKFGEPNGWESEYKPKTWIQEIWYRSVLSGIK